MPANPKYLETSKWQRFAKISAGIIGGYIISLEMHYLLALIADQQTVLDSMEFTLYLVWVAFMFLPFLFKSGWTCWAWYAATALLSALLIYVCR